MSDHSLSSPDDLHAIAREAQDLRDAYIRETMHRIANWVARGFSRVTHAH